MGAESNRRRRHINMNGNIMSTTTILLLGISVLSKVAQGIPVPMDNPEDIDNSHKPAPEPFLATASRTPVVDPENIENTHKPAPDPFLRTASTVVGEPVIPIVDPEDIENSHKPAPEPFLV